jgi:phospholipase/carboxylesterase
MTTSLLSCVEIAPRTEARSAVIWLHGLGADGHDFEPIVPELGLEDLAVRFVFPHAPVRPVAINGNMPMRAWYDIYGLTPAHPQDEAGIQDSTRRVTALVAREVDRGVPPERIAIAGFSQGGAIALHLALRHPDRLACVVALSTWLPRAASLDAERSTANAKTPFLLCHGTFDPMVGIDRGRTARLELERRGYDVTWKEYPMQHQVCMEEIRDVAAFLREALA